MDTSTTATLKRGRPSIEHRARIIETVERLVAEGKTVRQACIDAGTNDVSYYCWRDGKTRTNKGTTSTPRAESIEELIRKLQIHCKSFVFISEAAEGHYVYRVHSDRNAYKFLLTLLSIHAEKHFELNSKSSTAFKAATGGLL